MVKETHLDKFDKLFPKRKELTEAAKKPVTQNNDKKQLDNSK
jgi:hypothetical protein